MGSKGFANYWGSTAPLIGALSPNIARPMILIGTAMATVVRRAVML